MYLVYRTETFAKLFFIVSFTGLFMYVALAFYSFHTAYSTVSQIAKHQQRISKWQDMSQQTYSKLVKYILIWEVGKKTNIEETQAPFINSDCSNINCYITSNKTLLNGNYTNFDAIVFDLSAQNKWQHSLLPKRRSPYQKYIFYSRLPANDNPICNVIVNNYFNWTWTYKLTSDIVSPFIEVRNCFGYVIGPHKDMIWPKPEQQTTEVLDLSDDINTKTKAVIWIMQDCVPKTQSVSYISKLQKSLEANGLELDIFGCGNLDCPEGGCMKAVERDYFFYLIFESSMSEDYVTDEVVNAFKNDAIPLMIGGADYTKFFPEKSYISNQDLNEEEMAVLIESIVKTPNKYREYQSWRKAFTIQKPERDPGYCQLCKYLNDDDKLEKHSCYENFRKWWYPESLRLRCIHKDAELYSKNFYNFKGSSKNKTIKV